MRPAAAELGGETTNFNETCRIGDDVIGGKRDDDRVVGALGRKGGASRNCGPQIATHRFEQNVGFGAYFRQLFRDQEPILRIGHDNGSSEHGRI